MLTILLYEGCQERFCMQNDVFAESITGGIHRTQSYLRGEKNERREKKFKNHNKLLSLLENQHGLQPSLFLGHALQSSGC